MNGQLNDGRSFKIWFRHYTDPTLPKGTEAHVNIINDEYSGVQLIGISRCNPVDVFFKETGRQFALERAVEGSNLSEMDKDRVWNVYNNRGTKSV